MEEIDSSDEGGEEEDKDDEEYNEFVVPPGGDDMSDSDEDTSEGNKESADELEAEGGDDMSEEEIVHVISSGEEAKEKNKKKTKRPRANAPVRMSSDVWAHFHKVREPCEKTREIVLKAVCNYCINKKYAYTQGGSTSTIGRHMLKCEGLRDKMARNAIQTTLELHKINGPTSGPTMHPSIQ